MKYENLKHKLHWAVEQYVKLIQYANIKKTTDKHLKFKAYAKQQSTKQCWNVTIKRDRTWNKFSKNHICVQDFLFTANQHRNDTLFSDSDSTFWNRLNCNTLEPWLKIFISSLHWRAQGYIRTWNMVEQLRHKNSLVYTFKAIKLETNDFPNTPFLNSTITC